MSDHSACSPVPVIVMMLAIAAAGVSSAQSYRVTEVPSFGGNACWAIGVSDEGKVVGQARNQANQWQSYLWHEPGNQQLIPPLRSSWPGENAPCQPSHAPPIRTATASPGESAQYARWSLSCGLLLY